MCGASAGREGPTVQVGASIMFAVGRWSPRRQPGLVLAGAAAGVAAAFNTPLAGIVFGIEEMSRSFEVRTSGLIICAVIAAGLTSLALVGNYTYFGTTPTMLADGIDWLAIPICGVVGGLAGGLFSRLVSWRRAECRGRRQFLKQRPVVFALLCGLGVALCGLVSGDMVYGTGYAQVKIALENGGPLPQSFASSSSSPPRDCDERHSGRHFRAIARGRRRDRQPRADFFQSAPMRAMSSSAWSPISRAWCRRRSPPSSS